MNINPMTHQQILSRPHRLEFRHKVSQPKTPPTIEVGTFQMWQVADGFVVRPVQRSGKLEKCLFVFPYFQSVGSFFFCPFDEIKPYKPRIKYGEGNIYLFGNKTPTRLLNAIHLIHRALNRANDTYLNEKRAIKVNLINYTTKRIHAIYGTVSACVYNGEVYTLKSSKMGLEYALLGSSGDLSKVVLYVMDHREDNLCERFGFSTEEFIKLAEKSVKTRRGQVLKFIDENVQNKGGICYL